MRIVFLISCFCLSHIVYCQSSKTLPLPASTDNLDYHTLYNKDRKLSQVGSFKSGKLWNGKRYKYNEEGTLVNIEVYENGKLINENEGDKSVSVDSSEIIVPLYSDSIIDIKQGFYTDTIYVDKTNCIKMEGLFNSGRLWNGKWYRYDDDNVLIAIEIYEEGHYIRDDMIK